MVKKRSSAFRSSAACSMPWRTTDQVDASLCRYSTEISSSPLGLSRPYRVHGQQQKQHAQAQQGNDHLQQYLPLHGFPSFP